MEYDEKIPTWEKIKEQLSGISGNEFLSYSCGDLRLLFAEDLGNGSFSVGFYGNRSAYRAVGAGDLLDSSVRFAEIDGVIGKRTVTEKGKTGYVSPDGTYLVVDTGSSLKPLTSVSEEDMQLFASIQTYDEEQEKSANEKFKENFKVEEQEIEISWKEMKERNVNLIEGLALNIEDVDKDGLANEIIGLSAADFVMLRRKYGGRQLSKMFKNMGLDKLNRTSDLLKAVNDEVNKAVSDERFAEVLSVFGGKEAMKNILMKLATHETAGPPIKPFNWSSTACMGYFHFNFRNTVNYKINPTHPAEAVRGELMLMADNLDYLKEKTNVTPEMLLGAHNSGAGNALRNRSAGHGNPLPTEFARIVLNKTDYAQMIAQFQNYQNQEKFA